MAISRSRSMIEAARRRGYAYQVLTDHTQSLAIARGLNPARVAEQAGVIAALNARFAAEEAAGTAPPETPPEGFRLLHGCELEVRADGKLDFEDDLLARFDLVVASVHVGRRQPKAQLTAADARRDPQSARRRPGPSVRAQDRPAARPRSRLGPGLRRSRPDRDGAGDERLAATARPRRRASASRGRDGLPAVDRFGRPRPRRARLRPLGDQPGPPCVGGAGARSSTRGRGTTCWPGPAASRAGSDGSSRVRRSRITAAHRDLALAAVTLVGLSRLSSRRSSGSSRDPAARGDRSSAPSRSSPTRRRRPKPPPGVAIEALILPAGRRRCLSRRDPARAVRVVARAGPRRHLAARPPHPGARGADPPRPDGPLRGRPDRRSSSRSCWSRSSGSRASRRWSRAGSSSRRAAAGPLPETNLLILAAGDGIIAGLLGYRAVALRIGNLVDALWSAATYLAAIAIGAAALRAMEIPRLIGPALLTLAFYLWDCADRHAPGATPRASLDLADRAAGRARRSS